MPSTDPTFGPILQRLETLCARLGATPPGAAPGEAGLELVLDRLDVLEEALTRGDQAWREIEAERAKSLFAAKLASLGEMAAGVAHEINTPLALIALKAGQAEEMLQEGHADPEALKKANQSILATVGRISKIIRSLRSFARDGSQDEMSSVPVAELIADCAGLCAERFRINGVLFTDKVEPGLQSVNCRPTEIMQVLISLLNNAFDAALPMPEKWVKLEASERDGWLEIAVSDSGPGVPESKREKVFEPFYSGKASGKGTGMGLSISRSIAGTHGGSLEYDPSLNCSRFVLRLPGLNCVAKGAGHGA